MLMTIRSHDQFNTTIYGMDDRYRGITNGRRVIFLNMEDMRDRGLAEGELVDITSHFVGPRAPRCTSAWCRTRSPALRGGLFP